MSSQKILTFPIKSIIGEEIEDTITLTLKVNEVSNTTNYIIHRAYITQRFNERQGTVNTLTRAEVRGGGRKPWRQKGTGRARAGSNTSPLWKGGGVSFGPKPKLYENKINRKEWQLGLRSLIVAKKKKITILDDINLIGYNTNAIKKNFKSIGVNLLEKTLIVVTKIEKTLLNSTRNIKSIKLLVANNLNIKEILSAKNLFITVDSLKIIEETYNV